MMLDSNSNSDPLITSEKQTVLSPNYNICKLGQVFTPNNVVSAMLSLRRNSGRTLEPSGGNGAFSSEIKNPVVIEIDPSHAPPGSLIQDFFSYPTSEQFETIIGNPPYVRYRDIIPSTKALIQSKRFDSRSNLYLFFIEKSIEHLAPGGELIFITPRDFLKITSSVELNKWLYSQGTITDAIELGDTKVFPSAVPNCLIWRFEKGCFNRITRYAEIRNRNKLEDTLLNPNWEPRYFEQSHGHLMFTRQKHSLHLKELASIKVGAVSGADEVYSSEEHGNRDFVCSSTVKTGQTRRMIWVERKGPPPEALFPHREKLLQRKIRKFHERNWWQWGRGYPVTDAPRIYVNSKTRYSKPFFVHHCPHFDGAILGVFPHNPEVDLYELCEALNQVEWDQLGFVCDGRFIFSQRSLENAPLPESFNQFLPLSAPPPNN
jgi:adenine-specific DNA-methyltransferase